MSPKSLLLAAVAACVSLGVAPRALPQGVTRPVPPPQRPGPRLEPVAETRLLMEGLNQANFRGLEKILKEKPTDDEAWVFARGQSLLIAETGNLLMLRPPKNPGEAAWMEHATDLRDTATKLSRTVAKHDYDGSRAALRDVADSCNRCHKTFRSSARIKPFAASGELPAPQPEPK
jgi:hypothetical protein